ncbi:MAG: tetratricopeptide repeat protein [Saccharothrix sp.]|nr:tetratricopeptide repeat protein [Saccharothrix sp.]
MATLLLRANEVVSADALVERLWPDGPPNPRRARATLHMAVTRLRQALGEANVVRTVANGYLIAVADGALDLHRFRESVRRGEFAEALGLWRGEPLADVRSDRLHVEDVAPLLDEHLAAVEGRVEADLAAGRFADVVPELRELTRRHPFREDLWGQLIRALHGADRQADALAAYHSVRALLAEQLGVDPGPKLTDSYERVLRGEVPRGVGAPPVPRRLPPHPGVFVGREAELAALDEATAGPASAVLLHGLGGVGKTALALRWAHHRRDRFPDGDLFVNLRGFDAASHPVTPRGALESLLSALGVPVEDVPADLDGRAALFRETTAGRRLLLVLDNAADSDQVLPLLTGSFTVLVTSRNQLRGLAVRQGVRRMAVPPLPDAGAEVLLSNLIGVDRVHADPGAIGRVIDRCGGLPLALRVFAERATRFPTTSMTEFAAELADERTRLDVLAAGEGEDTDVRSVLSWSYHGLDDESASLFRLLSVHPGPVIGVAVAAALAGRPETVVRKQLERLTSDHLVDSRAPGRYEFHDLLRSYSKELRAVEDERESALERVVAWYVAAAESAAFRSPAYRPGAAGRSYRPAPPVVDDVEDPGGWTRREWPNLIAVVRAAAGAGLHESAWRLCEALWWMVSFIPIGDDAVELFRIGRDSVHRMADRYDRRGVAFNYLGCVYARVGAFDQAVRTFEEALAVVDDRPLECVLRGNLGVAHARMSRLTDAVEAQAAALLIAEEVGDRHREAAAHFNLAQDLRGLRRHGEALAHARRALEIFRSSGDDYFHGRAMMAAASACRALGRFEDAESYSRRGLAAMDEFRDRFSEGLLLEELGTVLLCLDRFDEAMTAWRRAVGIYDEFERHRAARIRTWLDDYGVDDGGYPGRSR